MSGLEFLKPVIALAKPALPDTAPQKRASPEVMYPISPGKKIPLPVTVPPSRMPFEPPPV